MSASHPVYQAGIHLFRPESGSIHSTQITDIINGPRGEVLVATAFGLSTYNGSWSTRHINRDNFSVGLMDDYVTSLEYDTAGNLWIGFGGGLQIYNGYEYSVIRDPELLKSLEIRDLQRWNDDMWVATGNAALHRYHNGTWTWFAPHSRNGPGFYEADSMVLDSATDSLLIATGREGLWRVTALNDTVRFDQIERNSDPFGLLGHVRRDPLGGAYFYNATQVAHYDSATGFTSLVSTSDVGGGNSAINDVAGGSDGTLYVATDNGIYVWVNGQITDHWGAFEGFGSSQGIRTVFTDAENRLWFSTQDDVGYYAGEVSTDPLIAIESMTATPTPMPPVSMSQDVSPTKAAAIVPQQAAASQFDQIFAAIYGFFSFLHPTS
ncbi:MAG: two-component regulator propeller domain-containing protein [Methanoregula sp.]